MEISVPCYNGYCLIGALLLLVLYPPYHHTYEYEWNNEDEKTESPDADTMPTSDSGIGFGGFITIVIIIMIIIGVCVCLHKHNNTLRIALHEPQPRMSARRDIYLTRTNQDRRRPYTYTNAGHAFPMPELRTTATENIYYSELSTNNEGQTALQSLSQYKIAPGSTIQSPFGQNESVKKLLKCYKDEDDTIWSKQINNKQNAEGLM